ncbi:MAG: c-type cytochrome [Verrucomicrobia bacterium]|nr:c-type cytochrome [Verrucomicrobiota bacterium]
MKTQTLRLAACLLATLSAHAAEPLPEWIWHNYQKGDPLPQGTEVVFMRKKISIASKPASAELKICGDDSATVFLNGKQIVVATSRAKPGQVNYSATAVDVAAELKTGENLFAVMGRNGGGPFGVIAKLEITYGYNKKDTLLTDTSWLTSAKSNANWQLPDFKPAGWTRARHMGFEGDNPWFEVMNPPGTAEQLTLLPGFKAELIRKARDEEGSWIAMTVDDKGRIIVSPQLLVSSNFGGMLRFTLGADGRIAKEEKIAVPVGGAQGMVYAHGALYVNGYAETYTPDKHALYLVRDSNGDDIYDHFEPLKQLFNAGGSHGPHGVDVGPDGLLYHVSGDYSHPVDGTSADSPHKNYAEDLLLPRSWDASGHAMGKVAPMGTVQRFDRDGKKWQLFAAGLRNPYDLCFNADGEAFTYDADMEYDTGLPWYRPTRVYHVVSGGEYGHREGTGKWPYYYPDSLPPAVDIGLGSPVGLKFGTRSKFPPKYQRALFLGDWAWGHIYAVHFKPQGASYAATFEKFASGRPLNVVDLEFGRDGAMYFITGGNRTGSGLYRVSYAGPKVEEKPKTKAEQRTEQQAAEARALRKQLEAFHGKRDAKAVDFAWPHLDSEDRFLRYAARIAIEWQEPASWHTRALVEARTRASLTALLAVARTAKAEQKAELIRSLQRLAWNKLDEAQKLELLRVYSVAFARLGGPNTETRLALVKLFDPQYPAKSDALNRELCEMLVFLEAPSVVPKTMKLLASAPTQEQQIHYIYYLRQVAGGWTPALRRAYFEWYGMAAVKFRGGVSFNKFLANFKKDAIAALSPAERKELEPFLKDFAPPVRAVVQRPFVKEWKFEELLPALDTAMTGRNFAKGKAAFDAAQCSACHRFLTDGGSVGPDLTGVGSRFSRRDILESILAPSKVVMEQYQNTTVFKKDGDDVSGRLIEEDDKRVVLVVNPLTGDRAEVLQKDIARREPSKLSPMPEGLVNVLTRDEILDLVAYLESGGTATHAAFKK